jgi:hypothetical protein
MRGCSLIAWAGCASILAVFDGYSEVSSRFPALAAEQAAHTHTNWIENTVTNLVEVRMSRNRFVTEYRTNWVDHISTNVFADYKTNRLIRNLTNHFVVDAWRTNVVDAHRTNWHRLNLTNEIAVNVTLTNVIDAYHTNWQTLSLTNWQTMVVMRTNWITQFVTNVAQIELPKTVTVTPPVPERSAPAPVTRTASTEVSSSDDPVIEVSRTSKPAANGLVEVELKIRWPADTADAPPVQQWRIEREGGTFLSFGQEQECRKELPVGNYIVQARLQRDADSPSFLLKGTLTVTIKEAVVQQRTDRSKLAAIMGRQ